MGVPKEPTKDQLVILLALNRTGKHVYAGTVTEKVKAKRRAKARVQKQSRRINRGK